MEVLARFEITIEQIYCVTSDNGKNYVKAKKILQQNRSECVFETELMQTDAEEIDTDAVTENCYDDSDCDSINEQDDYELDEHDSESQFDTFEMGGVVKIIRKAAENSETYLNHTNFLQTIACATHTVHLIVTDVLKGEKWSSIILNVRELVKNYRTPKFQTIQKRLKLNRPVLDVRTRWNSICSMVGF